MKGDSIGGEGGKRRGGGEGGEGGGGEGKEEKGRREGEGGGGGGAKKVVCFSETNWKAFARTSIFRETNRFPPTLFSIWTQPTTIPLFTDWRLLLRNSVRAIFNSIWAPKKADFLSNTLTIYYSSYMHLILMDLVPIFLHSTRKICFVPKCMLSRWIIWGWFFFWEPSPSTLLSERYW